MALKSRRDGHHPLTLNSVLGSPLSNLNMIGCPYQDIHDSSSTTNVFRSAKSVMPDSTKSKEKSNLFSTYAKLNTHHNFMEFMETVEL